MNAIIIIQPYLHAGTWVFDDPDKGLCKEPFVSGIDLMLNRITERIVHAESGFRLLFSAMPFPGYEIKLDWRRPEYGGNWYYCTQYEMEGWLCPALVKYFGDVPPEIYAKAESGPPVKSGNAIPEMAENVGLSKIQEGYGRGGEI